MILSKSPRLHVVQLLTLCLAVSIRVGSSPPYPSSNSHLPPRGPSCPRAYHQLCISASTILLRRPRARVLTESHDRATVSQECVTAYNDLKLSKKYKYIIYKLSDDNKQIVVDEASADKDWENFREKLVNATTKSKSVRQTPPEDAVSHLLSQRR